MGRLHAQPIFRNLLTQIAAFRPAYGLDVRVKCKCLLAFLCSERRARVRYASGLESVQGMGGRRTAADFAFLLLDQARMALLLYLVGEYSGYITAAAWPPNSFTNLSLES
eukprot:scaffold152983_cov34-Tisochrysis_lutea.AAC.1